MCRVYQVYRLSYVNYAETCDAERHINNLELKQTRCITARSNSCA